MTDTELKNILQKIKDSSNDEKDYLAKIKEVKAIIDEYNKLLKKLLEEVKK